MIKYYFSIDDWENTVVDVDTSDLPDFDYLLAEIHTMCAAVINFAAVKYITEEYQENFTEIARKQLADMLLDSGTDLQGFKEYAGIY